MNKTIILLSGFAKSGKDTLADILVKEHGFKKLSIADKLKKDVSKKYNISLDLLNSQKGKEMYIESQKCTIRNILIKEAACQRSINDNIYIDDAIQNMRLYNKIVISDIRYMIEIQKIKNTFYEDKIITVRINRFDKSPVCDVSETQLDSFGFDYVINNTGYLSDFKTNINNFIKFSNL